MLSYKSSKLSNKPKFLAPSSSSSKYSLLYKAFKNLNIVMRISLVCSFLLLFVLQNNLNATFSFDRYDIKHVAIYKKIQEKLSPRRRLQSINKTEERVFYPQGYGADPSGIEDSSDAILKAVSDAFQVQKGLRLLPNVNDLGGVVIDFQGGNYVINQPIPFPPLSGNVVVRGGTIRASNTFPGDRHLFELSSKPSKHLHINSTTNTQNQISGIQYVDITFRDILFDSSFRGGGLTIVDSARIRVTNCYFLHFSTQGILVQGGHETFISDTFLGQHETVGGDPGERQFTGTAIDVGSNDNAITNVVVFSAAVGIILRGQANMITGAHLYNKATDFGGVGILVKLAGLSQTRIDNCYLDYNSIVMEDPVQVHVTNGFFLGDGNVVVKSVQGRISGLNIVNNMFSGDPSKNKAIVELQGEFNNIDQVVVEHNNVIGMKLKSTVGKLSIKGSNTTKWQADFSKMLLFSDRIAHFQYSIYSKGGVLAVHGVTNVSNNVVTVETDKPIDGVVSVLVYQYNVIGEEIN
ncbi:polygalacturonase QRT3-like [Chenopodium quinoa]|uniref:polygalacturonase QRT3-like n=1 Tax=Chenopodium quinoa TaxID=63459 RepID=UPI000B770A0F|nr:polygalacturonase QRT3-like [Chenopodium quinoa]